ncbi:MAG: beta-1,6-N-acetylglucosaminyltransferase [Metamycoplasmataceae bacterium]
MKLVVCIIFFGKAELLKLKFEKFFNDESINYIVSYNKRNYDEYLKAKEMDYFKKNNIYLFSEVDVYWGDVSILQSELKCIEKAKMVFPDFSHLVILSGRTIPYRNWNYIKEKLSQNEEGNWLNFNHKQPFLFKYWFKNNTFWANLCLNFEKPKINKNENQRNNINFLIKNTFIENYKKDHPLKYFWYKYFVTKDLLILSIVKNKKNRWDKNCKYFFSEEKYDKSYNDILNIMGANLIFNNREKLEIMLKSEEKTKLLTLLENKHAPEEIFWTLLYKNVFGKYKEEESNNPFLWFPIQKMWSKRIFNSKVKNIKNKNPNSLFFSRVYTEKEIKKFENIMNL